MSSIKKRLYGRLKPAFDAIGGQSTDPSIRPSQYADFQADGALALARRLGAKPRDIAQEILEKTELGDLCSAVQISGPGFINLTISDDLLESMLKRIAEDIRLGIPNAKQIETVVVDYSAPNAAKEMHVGHLRSTIIGDAAVRLFEWMGHTVIRQNHIGDWGTPFGMLIEHLLDIGEVEAIQELSVGDLSGFYQEARTKFDASESFRDRARKRVVLLQGGDKATLRLWNILIDGSKKYFLTVYSKLGVRLTDTDFYGESFYNDRLKPVVNELHEHGLLRESNGAKCVFPTGFTNRTGEPLPLIVEKSDGGYGYATTDLAAIRYRILKLSATRLLYVIGLPQSQHMEMIFETAREMGWLTKRVQAQHVGHGSIQGADGKILRTRAGTSLKLLDLLNEAVGRAAEVVSIKSPKLERKRRAEVAKIVGIGAVKYADLSVDRTKDYVFDFDRMIAFEGNTAPYIQYAYARIMSILRRTGHGAQQEVGCIHIRNSAERELAVDLLAFSDVLEDLVISLEFHHLASYLFGLATTFAAFYENCPVMRAEGEVRTSRIVMCELTARTLELGLGLLGITAPDEM